MKKKLCLFALLMIFSSNVLAEYYLVYTPPQCTDCVDAFPPHNQSYHHKAHKVYKHKHKPHVICEKKKIVKHPCYKPKYKPKAIKVHTQRNSCGECENCICGNGYAISTSQPQYPGEHCTTYEDELRGRQDFSSY